MITEGALYTPTGYQHSICPTKSSNRTALIIGAVGCGALGLMVVALLAFLAIWQFLSPEALPVASADAGAREPLSQSFTTKNGLGTIHYPASFAASTPNDQTVVVQRHSSAGAHFVAIYAIDHPVSEHLDEVDRVIQLELAKSIPDFVATPSKPGLCHGEPGIVSSGSYPEAGEVYELHGCAFMKDEVYHRCSYGVAKVELGATKPLLEEICERVEIHPLPTP
jgi:hypothetical protein